MVSRQVALARIFSSSAGLPSRRPDQHQFVGLGLGKFRVKMFAAAMLRAYVREGRQEHIHVIKASDAGNNAVCVGVYSRPIDFARDSPGFSGRNQPS
jgi:hypothetical protein